MLCVTFNEKYTRANLYSVSEFNLFYIITNDGKSFSPNMHWFNHQLLHNKNIRETDLEQFDVYLH